MNLKLIAPQNLFIFPKLKNGILQNPLNELVEVLEKEFERAEMVSIIEDGNNWYIDRDATPLVRSFETLHISDTVSNCIKKFKL